MSTRSRILEKISNAMNSPKGLTARPESCSVSLPPLENFRGKEEKSKLSPTRSEPELLVDDPVASHPDSCPDCATQLNCKARRDCLELVKAGYRADPHDGMTCSCLRCMGIRGERPGTDSTSSSEPNSEELASIRSQIERLLEDGPKPYELILEAVGGEEAAIRKAIRGWDDLIAYYAGGMWVWEIRSATANIANFATDPITLAERVGIRFEAETPESLGNPVFQYRGHILAWENDTPETKVYAWGLVNLFPGRPLSVDAEPVGRLLGLSPRAVRETLARLTKDGDLVRTWERGRELFRLSIQYPEGGRDVRFRAGSFCPGACGLDASPHGQGAVTCHETEKAPERPEALNRE